MKKYLHIVILLILTSVGVVFALPSDARANFKCGGADIPTSIDFSSYASRSYCTDPNATPVTALLLIIIEFLSIGVGIAVVGGIAYGGVRYAASGGDAGKTKEAIGIITNAVIGLVLFVFMYAIINFFVPGGVFN